MTKLLDKAFAKLRELPGVGPYAAAHIMLLFGRRSRLALLRFSQRRYRPPVRAPDGCPRKLVPLDGQARRD